VCYHDLLRPYLKKVTYSALSRSSR
jgi:hypothetical protein